MELLDCDVYLTIEGMLRFRPQLAGSVDRMN